MKPLKELYQSAERVVVTAHRGFSSRFPENTLTAFDKAVEVGADIIEFDVCESQDGELVILHDTRLDRTTDGTGPVAEKKWEELQKLNATYWAGTHDTGQRLEQPAGVDGIPSLASVLERFAGKVGLNIQVKFDSLEALSQLAQLYLDYALQESGFLMLKSFEQGEHIRKISPEIMLCIGGQRDDLKRHVTFGVDFMQPRKSLLTPDFLQRINAAGIPYNVFYANTETEMQELLDYGVPGILTDAPDILLKMLKAR